MPPISVTTLRLENKLVVKSASSRGMLPQGKKNVLSKASRDNNVVLVTSSPAESETLRLRITRQRAEGSCCSATERCLPQPHSSRAHSLFGACKRVHSRASTSHTLPACSSTLYATAVRVTAKLSTPLSRRAARIASKTPPSSRGLPFQRSSNAQMRPASFSCTCSSLRTTRRLK